MTTTIDDRQLGIGRVYAEAMLDVASERGEAESLGEELAELESLLAADPSLRRFVESPLVEAEERSKALERALRGRASDLMVDSLMVIDRKGRLALLPAIIEAYRRLHRERRGLVDVEVTSPVPLTEDLRQRLAAAADKVTGRRSELRETVDPSILGGLVIQIADEKIDASVATRLRRLAATLTGRATQEILKSRDLTVSEPGD